MNNNCQELGVGRRLMRSRAVTGSDRRMVCSIAWGVADNIVLVLYKYVNNCKTDSE